MQTDNEFLCELANKIQDNIRYYPFYSCDDIMSDINGCVFSRCANFRDFIRPYIENNKEKILNNNLYDFSKKFKSWFRSDAEIYSITYFSNKLRIFEEAEMRIPLFIQKYVINYNLTISDTEKSNYFSAKQILDNASDKLAKISDVEAVYGFLNTMKMLDDAAIEAGVSRDNAHSITLIAAKALSNALTNENEIAGAASYLPRSTQQKFIDDTTALVSARAKQQSKASKHSLRIFTTGTNGDNDNHRTVKTRQQTHRHP